MRLDECEPGLILADEEACKRFFILKRQHLERNLERLKRISAIGDKLRVGVDALE